jgi:hypothetical protein
MPKSIFVIFIISTFVTSGFIFHRLFLTHPNVINQTQVETSSSNLAALYPDLESFNDCRSGKLKIDKEFAFSSIKFIMVANEGSCSMYNYYSKILKVLPNNKLKLVEASCGSARQEDIKESPNKKYLLLNNGCHSGACYHTNGISIYDIAKDKIIFTNLIDLDGRNPEGLGISKFDWQTTENIKWLDNSSIQYDETLLLAGACASTKDTSLNSVAAKFINKKEGIIVDLSLL